MKKKHLVKIMSVLLAISLVGCGSNPSIDNPANPVETTTPTEVAPETVVEDGQTSDSQNSETSEDTTESATIEEDEKTAQEELERQEAEKEVKEELERQEAERKALITNTNSISMLNYLTVIAEEVHQSSNNRLFLEEASRSLLNNLYPNAVDKTTQTHVSNMVRNIDELRMIATKRDRLAYIYKQNKAAAMKSAMPSPMSILNVVSSTNPLKALASVTYLAVDSYSSYTSTNNSVELSYLKDGWELDDAEDSTLSENRIEAFNYMQNIIRDNGLDGDLALNSDAIIDFVKWQNETNVTRRIQFLEQNESVYSAFGGYWLLLSKSYYEDNNFEGCISAIDTYLETQPRIFRKDTELAAALPYAIASVGEVREENALTEKEQYYTEHLYENTKNDDWALNYFAAVTYMDLYSKTKDQSYLEKAYTIAKNNVNELIEAQQKLNGKYCSELKDQEMKVPEDATKEQKKEIEKYNKMLKEVRKTELPPVDNALLINTQLLLSLANEIGISSVEKSTLDAMLHENRSSLFLVDTIDSRYWFTQQPNINLEGDLSKNTLTIPATYVCENSRIEVSVNHGGTIITYDDWMIDEVKRPKNSEINDYSVSFSSAKMKKADIKANDTATVTIYPYGDDVPSIELRFNAKEKKILLYYSYEWELTE